jgi:hypothetical protein
MLVPACATPALPGMEIRTDGPRVSAARLRSVEMLLAEHDGDCSAPCTRSCPAQADIPGMMRLLARGEAAAARARLYASLPMAGSLAAVCPAPCRRACRRGAVDSAIDICGVKAALASDLAADGKGTGRIPPSGRTAAIVGAGPAGMAVAWFLARAGHACAVMEERTEPGGMLRASLSAGELPPDVLARDVSVLRAAGVDLRMDVRVGAGPGLADLRHRFDAVVLCTGSPQSLASLLPEGMRVDPATGCAAPGLFACGNAIRNVPSHMAARAVGDARRVSRSVDLFFRGKPVVPEPRGFSSRRRAAPGASGGELATAALLRAKRRDGARHQESSRPTGDPVALHEARRCLQCDCTRSRTCRLRALATAMGAEGRRYAGGTPPAGVVLRGPGGLTLDGGKCVKCGRCVSLAEAAEARPGLAFSGRGAETHVTVPFSWDQGESLSGIASQLVARCPTGALAWDR